MQKKVLFIQKKVLFMKRIVLFKKIVLFMRKKVLLKKVIKSKTAFHTKDSFLLVLFYTHKTISYVKS